jgi:hypothetical protein
MPIGLRDMEEGEGRALWRLAHPRTAPARLVERARVVWLAARGKR